MKRLIVAVLMAIGVYLAFSLPASAMGEICPVRLELAPVTSPSPTTLYGFEFVSDGARTVNATVAFDTDGGWFTVDVPAVTLVEKLRHFTGPTVTFTRSDWISPVMYIDFPENVHIHRDWIYTARTVGDNFGWQQQGTVRCPPQTETAFRASAKRFVSGAVPQMSSTDADKLDVPPAGRSIVLRAQTSAALGSVTCDEPFADAKVVKQSIPDFPRELVHAGIQPATSTVTVALNSDGSVGDAWVNEPSGYAALDNAAIAAAKASRYQAARAYCENVAGLYLFRVTFDPNH